MRPLLLTMIIVRVGSKCERLWVVGNVVMMLGAQRAVLVPIVGNVACPVPHPDIWGEFAEGVKPLPFIGVNIERS